MLHHTLNILTLNVSSRLRSVSVVISRFLDARARSIALLSPTWRHPAYRTWSCVIVTATTSASVALCVYLRYVVLFLGCLFFPDKSSFRSTVIARCRRRDVGFVQLGEKFLLYLWALGNEITVQTSNTHSRVGRLFIFRMSCGRRR